MITRFIGDIHGSLGFYLDAISEAQDEDISTIQVGDFGIGFLNHDPDGLDELISSYEDDGVSHRFIRGNHDDPDLCRKHSHFVPDGTVEGKVLYLGGATSIDRAWRTPGIDWWAGEEAPQDVLDAAVETWRTNEDLDVIVSHECPEFFATEVMIPYAGFKGVPSEFSRTRITLARMHMIRKPRVQVFGHWHRSLDVVESGTRFVCLGINEWKDIEV